MENIAPSEMQGTGQGAREGDVSCIPFQWWEESLGPGLHKPSLSEFFYKENGATASCLLQRGSHRVNDRVLDLFSAGEKRTVSQPGYKLSQPDSFKKKKRFT